MTVQSHGGYGAPYRYRGCNETEDRLKRAVDFLVDVRRQLVANANDSFWLDRYREADRAVRECCTAYLETPVPKPRIVLPP